MKKIIYILITLTLTISCTEPYALQTNTFEDAVVIEATITNELKKQEIKISRTFRLEEKEPTIETNATVYIIDDIGNTYNFSEDNGKYISEFEFQAMPDRQYQLFVNTSNGKQYTSTREKLTTINNLTSVEAKVKNNFGVNGVEITANSYDPNETSKYYRFDYEETYRFSVPYWASDSIALVGGNITFFNRSGPSKTCYITKKNNDILLINTSNLNEDRVKDFQVRFINQDNFIIADRYSILVKQYVQNIEAYTFYKNLKDFSSLGQTLSPIQPGFINGNISSNNPNERVIGFFDVSSYSEKRIFFNYEDIFPGEPYPPFLYECEVFGFNADDTSTPPDASPNGLYALTNRIESKALIYYKFEFPAIYKMVSPECGDCRVIGSNIVPPFWQ